MYRTLRAFAWMRWRILINSFERTGARDRLERFSIAIEQLGPIVAAVLMIPSVIALSGIAAAAGYILGSQHAPSLLVQVVRYLLLGATALSIVSPLVLPAGDRTNPVRMLLLPISRRTLYTAQAAATLSDPWIMLTVPMVVFLPVGLAVGGAFVAALVTCAGGVLLLLTIIGLTMLGTSVVQVVVRDRRRAELLALFVVVLLPLIVSLPAILDPGSRHGRSGRSSSHQPPPAWVAQGAVAIFHVLPSELYFASATRAASDPQDTPGPPVAALAAFAAALHAAGLFVFGKVLSSPGTTGFRRAQTGRELLGVSLPLTSPAASAVAFSQLRLALRTPRGRSILLSPVVVFAIFGVMARQTGDMMDVGVTTLRGGIGFAAFGCFISLLATLPIVMNQFAVDRAGLTLALLLPLSNHDLLRGKAIGNGLIAFVPAILCLTGGVFVFGGGSPAQWLSVPLAMFAMYVIVAPVAAIVSAVFPRSVDMNSIGGGSNAHAAAGFIGIASYIVAAAPAVALVFITSAIFHRPSLLPAVLIAWCAIASVISRMLFIPAERVFQRRRENLALVV